MKIKIEALSSDYEKLQKDHDAVKEGNKEAHLNIAELEANNKAMLSENDKLKEENKQAQEKLSDLEQSHKDFDAAKNENIHIAKIKALQTSINEVNLRNYHINTNIAIIALK